MWARSSSQQLLTFGQVSQPPRTLVSLSVNWGVIAVPLPWLAGGGGGLHEVMGMVKRLAAQEVPSGKAREWYMKAAPTTAMEK